MTVLDNIFDSLLPAHLTQRRCEFTDRLQSQHFTVLFCVVLYTLDLYAQMAQAGIGTIHRVQDCTVSATGLVEQFPAGVHLFCLFEELEGINNEKQVAVFVLEQTAQQVQDNLLHDRQLAPAATIEEFTVISAVRAISQPDQPIDRTVVADAPGQDERPEMVVHIGNLFSERLEKSRGFWDLANRNQTVFMLITIFPQNTYQQKSLFLLNLCYHQNPFDQSV